MKTENSWPAYPVVGSRVNAVQYDQILTQMRQWIRARSYGHFIVVANTHVVMESRSNPGLRQAVDEADLVIPDGMPLVVVGRMRGFSLPRRADGPGLVEAAFNLPLSAGWRHCFYGGTEESLCTFKACLDQRWPGLFVAGMYAPPFRPLTPEEDQVAIDRINAACPDVLWVGLGCPKQECWMLAHRDRLNVPVMLGVGQAFDILAGTKKRAPSWMCNFGLEWFYRLLHEPRRLWRRYLIYNPQFVCLVLREQIVWWQSQRRNKTSF